jgi:hypothetical protein
VFFFLDRQNDFKILIRVTRPGRGESTPRHLRIYANHTHIVDFADAEQTKPQLNISLLEGVVGVAEYPLRSAAFTNIHTLSLFFVRDCSLLSLCSKSSNHVPRANQLVEK